MRVLVFGEGTLELYGLTLFMNAKRRGGGESGRTKEGKKGE